MHIRTFKAPTLQEALAEIRRQMGRDATVLHTRDVNRGLFGVLGRSHVEVTAGLKPQPANESRQVPQKPADPPRPNASAPPTREVQRLTAEVTRLSQVVETLDKRTQLETASSKTGDISARLLALGIDPSITTSLAHEIDIESTVSDSELLQHLRQTIRARFHTAGPIEVSPNQQCVVALVGPTGVGKTTTIAKLAAGFCLQRRSRVGLITIDTYRIAAVDQLQKYAEVMDLPMEVVSSGDEMDAALTRLKQCDLVLIDTVGRSPHDSQQIEITRQLLDRAKPHETHLVISATSSRRTIEAAASRFACLAPTAIILSKLDEARGQPDLLCLANRQMPGLSYVTTGQNVPDNIDLAQPSDLVECIFEPSQLPRQHPHERPSETDQLSQPRNLLVSTN